MRPDRDDYVTVHYENINITNHVQFDPLKNGSTKSYGKAYDYLSVMHYGGCKAKICPENAFMGKDCRCYCKGPARDPIRRCDAVVSCDTPAIDMSVYSVYTANSEEIDSLEGKLYPDGTVLRLFDYMCVDSTVGNFTCVGGVWRIDVTECEHVFECEIGDYSNDNIELYLDGEKLEVGKLVHEGSEIKARCKHAHEGLAGSSSLLTCTDGKLVGDFPVDCPNEKCAVTYNPATGNVIDTDDDVIPNGTRINSDVSVTLSCLKGHIPDSQQLTCNFGKFKETVNGQLPVCTYVCQPEVGEERLVEYKNKDIIKKWTYGIGSYQGCRDKCNRFKRVLCRAFAFGYIGRNPKCQITFRNPIVSPEILQDQPFWTVWARECDLH
ncbi:hypothetical protein MAR_032947 [Mya arenaria]|uniref:Peptidase M12A domain-containing protein n=1 Tax=Mya arenaria TaxID=6604 RepID=A0ABY7G8G2_MYAAR|nr:hypothetical protein MAR_032947 [Mya arenaria]